MERRPAGVTSRTTRFLDVAIGVLVPTATALGIDSIDDSAGLRPGSLLLAAVALVAVWRGFLAAAICAATSILAVWWHFTEPVDSFRIRGVDVWGVAVFAATACLVLILVDRNRSSSSRAVAERRLSDALMSEAPVGLALLGTDLRFRRINRHLADMNGVPVADHLGRRPGEINAEPGRLDEPMMREVLRTRMPRLGEELSFEDPGSGIERHWTANYYPVIDPDGRVLGLGTTVDEVTDEVIARRRADRLLVLAAALAAVSAEDEFSSALASFLSDTYSGRAAVGLVDDGHLVVVGTHGSSDEFAARWDGRSVPLSARTPLTDAVRDGRTVELSSIEEFRMAYPGLDAERSASGDAALLSVPLRDGRAGHVVGAAHLSWSAPHVMSESDRVLLRTAVSMAELALRKMRLEDAERTDRFRAVLDALLDHVEVGRAVRDSEGAIADFVLDFVNAPTVDGAGRSASELVGCRVREMYPSWVDSGLFERLVEVVETGVPFTQDRVPYAEVAPDGRLVDRFLNLQVSKSADGYIAASRDVTDAVVAEREADQAQRLADQQRVTVELLQRSALPSEIPEVDHVRMAALYQPVATDQAIGGDWYDVFRLDDHRIALVIADVSGHGSEAASYMVQVRNFIRAHAFDQEDPHRVLELVNAVALALQESDGPFVTCCYATLDTERSVLRWSIAGHPPPLRIGPDGSSSYLRGTPGVPLSLFPDAEYRTQVTQLEAGDRLVFFTDGLVERRDESIDEGFARLAGRATGCAALTPELCVEALAALVEDRFDDLAVLCVDLEHR